MNNEMLNNITNDTHIVAPLAKAILALYENHPAPEEGTFFVTELLKGPKEVLLNRYHRNEVEKDLQQLIVSAMGTAKHKAIENLIISQADGNCLTERRFKVPVTLDTDFGTITVYLSGAIDLIYRDELGELHIVDWKECKLAKADKARNGEEEDWKKQLFLYAWLVEHSCMNRPKDGVIWAFPKDLPSRDFSFGDPAKWYAQPIVYDFSDREYEQKVIGEYLSKLKELVEAIMWGDGKEPRPCTQEEMWQKPPTFAVKKPASKKASTVCSSVAEAQKYLSDKGWLGKGYMIYERPSQPVKCCDWCDAIKWCNQGKQAIEEWEHTQPRTYNDKGVNV